MKQRKPNEGFTLVELLVVIGIIVILMAILFPVFQSVRENARQTNCLANLHQISAALKQYRTDFGSFPLPPYYDGTRYFGGVTALFPEYIPDKTTLICPDDRQIDGVTKDAKDKAYSSYNGYVQSPQASWDFAPVTAKSPDGDIEITGQKRTYNYWGYSQDGWDCFSYDRMTGTGNVPYATTLPAWLRNEGLSWRHYPRLYNRNAPDNTIIVHCVHHRDHYKRATDMMDTIVTVGGSAKKVNVSQMGATGTDPVAEPSLWVTQKD